MKLDGLHITGEREKVLAEVAKLRIDIDPIPDNRTKAETEWWTLQHSISSLPGVSDAIAIEIIHGDRPDFVLRIDRHRIGLEVTECIPPTIGSLLRSAATDENTKTYSPTDAWRHPHSTKPKTIQGYLQQDRLPAPLDGNEAERLMAQQIVESLKKKAQALRNPGFSSHATNWVLMYDRSGPGMTCIQEAISLAQPDIDRNKTRTYVDGAFLLSGGSVHDVLANG